MEPACVLKLINNQDRETPKEQFANLCAAILKDLESDEGIVRMRDESLSPGLPLRARYSRSPTGRDLLAPTGPPLRCKPNFPTIHSERIHKEEMSVLLGRGPNLKIQTGASPLLRFTHRFCTLGRDEL
jgi:hypothetical protein